MVQEFKEFLNKGNIVDLAVGFVMGLFFAAAVTSFVDDILMQIVAAIFGEPDFGRLTFDLGDAVIRYGNFINAVVALVVVAFALFLVVRQYNKMRDEADPGPTEIDLLTEIRDSLRAGS